jgi:hypothetical protein
VPGERSQRDQRGSHPARVRAALPQPRPYQAAGDRRAESADRDCTIKLPQTDISQRLVARAAWWGSADGAAPSLLDILDVADDPDRVDVGVGLLKRALGEVIPAGARPPEYSRFIPPDWREHASSRRAVEDRMAIVGQIGAQLLTERFRFEWRPGTPIAAPTGRIEFRPVSGDGELLDLMTLTMDGTLDARSSPVCHTDSVSKPCSELADLRYVLISRSDTDRRADSAGVSSGGSAVALSHADALVSWGSFGSRLATGGR